MKRWVMLLALLALASTSFAIWPPAIRLTDGPNENINPFLSMQDLENLRVDSILLVWQRSKPGGWDIFSRATALYDTFWRPALLVTSLPDSNLNPAAENYDQRRYCVWVNCHQDSQNVLCSRWTGSAWGPAMYVTQDAFPNSGPTILCRLVADTAWVAWASFRNNHWNLYSRYYNGSSWSPEIPVVENLGNNRSPRLFKFPSSTPPQYLSLVWESDAYGNPDILLSRYQGGAWSAPIRVTTGPQSDIQPCPMRGFSYRFDNRVNLLWASDSLGNWEVWGSKADSLATRERITNHPATDNEPSCINAFPSLNSHPAVIAWSSDRDGNRNIYAEYNGYPMAVEAVDTNRADDIHPQTSAVYSPDYLRFWVVWQSNRDGNWNLYGTHRLTLTGAVESESPLLRSGKALGKVYPIPFRPNSPLLLSLPQAGNEAVIAFYDLKGGLVSRMVAERKGSSLYQTTWDGRDAQGKSLPSGLYFLRAEGAPALYRMILLR